MGLLQHKNIAVVGGTSGIGLAASQAFLREGARVYVMGRAESLDAAREVLGERAVVRAGDARHEADVTAWLDAVPGELHGLYHVAGGSGRRQGDGALHELTEEGWAFTLGAATIALAVAALFAALFPDVMPASNDAANSLTIQNASSTPYTLMVMNSARSCGT